MNQKFILELLKLALLNDKEDFIKQENKTQENSISLIGQYVIIRTYTAGVWAGVLKEKVKNEVYLANARRLYYWSNIDGISLSGISLNGIDLSKSKICAPVDIVWLEAIEIIPCTENAKNTIISQPIYTIR
jgi:6-pyruvoyl-tetrahydropterin synthase